MLSIGQKEGGVRRLLGRDGMVGKQKKKVGQPPKYAKSLAT